MSFKPKVLHFIIKCLISQVNRSMIMTQDLVNNTTNSQSSPGDLAVVEGQRNGNFDSEW